jgi:hypothetical protein
METARRGDRQRLKGARWHFQSGTGNSVMPRQESSRLPSKGRFGKPTVTNMNKRLYQEAEELVKSLRDPSLGLEGWPLSGEERRWTNDLYAVLAGGWQ